MEIMVTTKEFALTRNDMLRILLLAYLKKKWWMLALVIIIGLANLNGNYATEKFFVIFAAAYPFLVLFGLWNYANSDENRNFYKPRHYEIDAEKITAYMESGSDGTIMVNDFVKTLQVGNYYLLYLSKNQFLPIAKDSFQSDSEKAWFYSEIFLRIKKK